jgi:hypothetical protein
MLLFYGGFNVPEAEINGFHKLAHVAVPKSKVDTISGVV